MTEMLSLLGKNTGLDAADFVTLANFYDAHADRCERDREDPEGPTFYPKPKNKDFDEPEYEYDMAAEKSYILLFHGHYRKYDNLPDLALAAARCEAIQEKKPWDRVCFARDAEGKMGLTIGGKPLGILEGSGQAFMSRLTDDKAAIAEVADRLYSNWPFGCEHSVALGYENEALVAIDGRPATEVGDKWTLLCETRCLKQLIHAGDYGTVAEFEQAYQKYEHKIADYERLQREERKAAGHSEEESPRRRCRV
jgi:hypothetical protein